MPLRNVDNTKRCESERKLSLKNNKNSSNLGNTCDIPQNPNNRNPNFLKSLKFGDLECSCKAVHISITSNGIVKKNWSMFPTSHKHPKSKVEKKRGMEDEKYKINE